MANYENRIKFLSETGTHLGEFDAKARRIVEDLAVPVNTINVSSGYAVLNRVGNTVVEVNKNVRAILSSLDSCITEFRNNAYNTGDFIAKVKAAAQNIEDNYPNVFEFEPVSLNSDGNENMSQSNLDNLCEVLARLVKLATGTLLEVSAARGPMKAENVASINNIGTSLENFTNSIVLQCSVITEQVAEMAKDYNLEIRNLEEATDGLRRIEATEINPDIKVNNDDAY